MNIHVMLRHDASEINFKIFEQGNDQQIHGENGEWELIDSKQTVIYAPDESTPYDFIGIERTSTFRRCSLFTMIHNDTHCRSSQTAVYIEYHDV